MTDERDRLSPGTAAEVDASPLRRAGPDDVPDIRALVRAAYAKWVPLIGREPEPMTVDYDKTVRDNIIDLVHVDGTLAALIGMVARPRHLLVANVAVHPRFQHRGLGRRLLRHAEATAAALGLHELRLYTNAKFEVNVKLYKQVGYQVFGDGPLPGGDVRLHMRKWI